jgi:hypothetical protein
MEHAHACSEGFEDHHTENLEYEDDFEQEACLSNFSSLGKALLLPATGNDSCVHTGMAGCGDELPTDSSDPAVASFGAQKDEQAGKCTSLRNITRNYWVPFTHGTACLGFGEREYTLHRPQVSASPDTRRGEGFDTCIKAFSDINDIVCDVEISQLQEPSHETVAEPSHETVTEPSQEGETPPHWSPAPSPTALNTSQGTQHPAQAEPRLAEPGTALQFASPPSSIYIPMPSTEDTRSRLTEAAPHSVAGIDERTHGTSAAMRPRAETNRRLEQSSKSCATRDAQLVRSWNTFRVGTRTSLSNVAVVSREHAHAPAVGHDALRRTEQRRFEGLHKTLNAGLALHLADGLGKLKQTPPQAQASVRIHISRKAQIITPNPTEVASIESLEEVLHGVKRMEVRPPPKHLQVLQALHETLSRILVPEPAHSDTHTAASPVSCAGYEENAGRHLSPKQNMPVGNGKNDKRRTRMQKERAPPGVQVCDVKPA